MVDHEYYLPLLRRIKVICLFIDSLVCLMLRVLGSSVQQLETYCSAKIPDPSQERFNCSHGEEQVMD